MNSYGERLLHERDVERQYHANALRHNLMVMIQKVDGECPWQQERWQAMYPHLCKFLGQPDSDYGRTEEDYFDIVSNFRKLSKNNAWLVKSLHESLERRLRKYVLPKPRPLKLFVSYVVVLLAGVLLGWAFF